MSPVSARGDDVTPLRLLERIASDQPAKKKARRKKKATDPRPLKFEPQPCTRIIKFLLPQGFPFASLTLVVVSREG